MSRHLEAGLLCAAMDDADDPYIRHIKQSGVDGSMTPAQAEEWLAAYRARYPFREPEPTGRTPEEDRQYRNWVAGGPTPEYWKADKPAPVLLWAVIIALVALVGWAAWNGITLR